MKEGDVGMFQSVNLDTKSQASSFRRQPITFPTPQDWADPIPAGRALNQPKSEGIKQIPSQNKTDIFRPELELTS